MFRLSLIFGFLFCLIRLDGQVSGFVTDEAGEGLPYVNIFIKNTSQGTTSNLNGDYTLKAAPGNYTLVFQYIGYETEERPIQLDGSDIRLDVSMKQASYIMPEITIEANAEDPAYAIIRQAQARRKSYLEQYDNYECNAYVRGFNKIFNAPEKIMGLEVGDLDGSLDSTRQGVIYLSESVSRLYVSGGKSKEIMFSSKVSGNDRGYSFNSAQEMDFNFYRNNLDLNRHIISPIGTNAMSVYDYKLEGAHIDENGQLVNRIKVIPKASHLPAFFGYIYINEDLWNINSVNLSVTREATQIPFIDTLQFTQSYIPLEKDRWMPISNVIRFRMGAFGFDIGGTFACVYSDYTLDEVDDSVFNREVYVVESEANTRSEMYWDSIRPIPLTREERLDYKRKDSIQIVRKSPAYLDSIDRANNRFRAGNILGGYSFQNSSKRINWSVTTPLNQIEVNTISGWNGSFGLNYRKAYNEERTRRFDARASINYAFSDNTWRPNARISYQANRTNNLNIELRGGRSLQQFNRVEPISERLNTLMTLFFRRNYMKSYDKKYLGLEFNRDLGAIFKIRLSMDYEDRSPLSNSYDGSLFYKNSRVFTENISGFEPHQALLFRASLRIKPGEQLIRYPDRVFKTGSEWPTIWLLYKQGLDALGGDSAFSMLHSTVSKQFEMSNLGTLDLYWHGGLFLEKPQFFVDQMHFLGNQTHLGFTQAYRYSFMLLPYYDYSTAGDFYQMHIHHNFEGFILNKLPLIRQLGWHLAGGFKYLGREGADYREWHLGIDNIGYRFVRFLRVDFVWSSVLSSELEDQDRFGIVVGLDFKI